MFFSVSMQSLASILKRILNSCFSPGLTFVIDLLHFCFLAKSSHILAILHGSSNVFFMRESLTVTFHNL